jgi:hypothetical protein
VLQIGKAKDLSASLGIATPHHSVTHFWRVLNQENNITKPGNKTSSLDWLLHLNEMYKTGFRYAAERCLSVLRINTFVPHLYTLHFTPRIKYLKAFTFSFPLSRSRQRLTASVYKHPSVETKGSSPASNFRLR